MLSSFLPSLRQRPVSLVGGAGEAGDAPIHRLGVLEEGLLAERDRTGEPLERVELERERDRAPRVLGLGEVVRERVGDLAELTRSWASERYDDCEEVVSTCSYMSTGFDMDPNVSSTPTVLRSLRSRTLISVRPIPRYA